MKLRTLLLAGAALALAACGGGGGSEQTVDFSTWVEAEVFYTYPYEGQRDVAPRAPVIVRFSEPVEVDAGNFTLEGPDGPVPFTVKQVDGGLSAVLTPNDALAVKSDYTLTLNDIRTENGEPSLPGDALHFTTRPALQGPFELRSSEDSFEVVSVNPDDAEVPFLDFSSVNVRLSQPVDPDSLVYGQTISLTQNGEVIPATLLAEGRYITLDPRPQSDGGEDPVEPVEAGATLTLTLTNQVRNIRGEALPAYTREFMPRDTSPRSTLAQRADPADTQLGCLDDGVRTSPITGEAINCVPLIAKLLGDNTASKQQGNVFAELAFAPNFPDKTPLRIPRGSLLSGDPLEVNIGGAVPAGFDSGEVTVTFLSDANGYLLPNPYSDDAGAPKQLRLTMDVAFDTETQKANGAFNQNLLQVELVGYAVTDLEKGSLVVDAVGMVEPRVLGVENAYGMLSFHMESYPDQESAPEQPRNLDAPQIATWMPGGEVGKQRPGDPIILTFDEPLDPMSVAPGADLTLTADGAAVPFDYYLDGVSIVIKPEQPLAYNTTYEIGVTDGITDTAGNAAQPFTRTFTMPEYIGSGHPAIATTTYPGFPCAADKTTWDIAAGDHGICRGGESDDDHLPVMPMPGRRSIVVQFSQTMLEESIQVGETCDTGSFRVEKIAEPGQAPQGTVDGNSRTQYACLDTVPGELEYRGRKVTFTPDQPWEDGATYRYVLMSENQDFSVDDCTSGEALCTVDNGPLQTAVLEAPEDGQGGPNLELYFTGAAANDNVFQELRNLPAYDTNADFVHQDQEPQPQEQPAGSGEFPAPPNSTELFVKDTGGLLLDARVGCDYDGPACPSDKFIYITADLDVEVVGYDAQEDAVRVNIYPTLLKTSSVDVYARLLLVLFPIDQIIATGPQIMRIRYEDRGNGRTEPVTGWIRETPDGPVFETNLDIYLSAPYLRPSAAGLQLSHDLYSYPLSLNLVGDVTFLEDGRLQIEQRNQQEQDVVVNIDLIDNVIKAADMTLGIPANGVFLNYVSAPIKN
ncbi:MAG: Ig-like domain-containing protein [Alcanivorax sp.]|uniref:Ig-like domain-containing protein n=1 Tax=Alloalcanivorax marinus TaxID=1177169 RepID=UPI0019565E45|nr:Ig-like domain-containing protein [Alloalcanivorax marinus]MBM7335231.1 Ig-like domain-containing protein [Alloalcanivorax marinus]